MKFSDDHQARVELYRRADGTYYLEVHVAVKGRAGLWLRGMLEHERRDQSRQVEGLACLLAEEVGERYGDGHDPGNMGRAAVDAYRELVSESKVQRETGWEPPREFDREFARRAGVAGY